MACGNGNQGICDTCGATEAGHEVKRIAVEFLRVMRWHHSEGVTIGGDPYEGLLCPLCAKDVKKRRRTTAVISQDELPLDWGSFQPEVKGEGYASR